MTLEEFEQKILEILKEYTTEMEGYSYFGSNPGIPKYEYEEIAEKIRQEARWLRL